MTIAFSYKKLQPEIEIGLKNKLYKVSGKTKKAEIASALNIIKNEKFSDYEFNIRSICSRSERNPLSTSSKSFTVLQA